MDELIRMLMGGDDTLIRRIDEKMREDMGDQVRFMETFKAKESGCDNSANCTKRDGMIIFTCDGDQELFAVKGVNLIAIDEHRASYLHLIFDPETMIAIIDAMQNAVNEVQARQAQIQAQAAQ